MMGVLDTFTIVVAGVAFVIGFAGVMHYFINKDL